MNIVSRPYQSEADLYQIQAATAGWIATAGFEGYLNPADIALRLFNGMREYNPMEIVRLWESAAGHMLAWGMVYPPWNSYEAVLHPDYRQHELAPVVLDWAEDEIINWLKKAGPENYTIHLDVFEGDTARIALLNARGYARGEHHGTISVRSLEEPIPQPRLPDGFSIRSLQGYHEAGKLVDVINASFGWHWTVETYTAVMDSPAYNADDELIVIAPDGRFAASCVLLPDAYNQSGMIENVGTRPEFRGLGLAKALLYAGMQYMKMQGFTLAMVPYGAHLGAANALYASVGFRPMYQLYDYTKVIVY